MGRDGKKAKKERDFSEKDAPQAKKQRRESVGT
jgi:hypothetical protein